MSNENIPAPRELNSVKEHKLTRRRVVKLASAAGFSTAVASRMTVGDVKASDSDEVTISLDVDGKRKYTMDADRLEWIQRATKATNEIKNKYFYKNGIQSVSMSGGSGEDNPHVNVLLEKNNDEKGERRGELPEESNGVRVETRETDGELNMVCDAECVPQDENFPGGQRVDVNLNDGYCTSSPQIIGDDYNFVGWSTAGHCFPGCSSDDTRMWYDPDNDDCLMYIVGTGAYIDPYRDVGFVSYDDHYDQSPSPKNLHPDHTEGVTINGTLSEEGMAVIDDEYDGENKIFAYGAGSCFTSGELEDWNVTQNASGAEGSCRDELRDQMRVDLSCTGETIADGDSGGIFFTPDPNTDSWWALGSVTSSLGIGCVWAGLGAQGFTVDERHNRAWRA